MRPLFWGMRWILGSLVARSFHLSLQTSQVTSWESPAEAVEESRAVLRVGRLRFCGMFGDCFSTGLHLVICSNTQQGLAKSLELFWADVRIRARQTMIRTPVIPLKMLAP